MVRTRSREAPTASVRRRLPLARRRSARRARVAGPPRSRPWALRPARDVADVRPGPPDDGDLDGGDLRPRCRAFREGWPPRSSWRRLRPVRRVEACAARAADAARGAAGLHAARAAAALHAARAAAGLHAARVAVCLRAAGAGLVAPRGVVRPEQADAPAAAVLLRALRRDARHGD